MVLKVRRLSSLWEKSVGLIGAKIITPVYFATRWGIHTFGVLEPIDIVILDDKMRVRVIHVALQPNRVFFWNPKYYHVIELNAGAIKKLHIKKGTIITLFFSSSGEAMNQQ